MVGWGGVGFGHGREDFEAGEPRAVVLEGDGADDGADGAGAAVGGDGPLRAGLGAELGTAVSAAGGAVEEAASDEGAVDVGGVVVVTAGADLGLVVG
jgi:hypothetical protein